MVLACLTGQLPRSCPAGCDRRMAFFSLPRFQRPDIERWLGEAAVAGACLFGMDGLAHLHLSVAALLCLGAGMGAVFLVRADPVASAGRTLVRIGLLAIVVAAIDRGLTLGMPLPRIAYLASLVGLAAAAYRGVLARLAASPAALPAGEPVRLALAGLLGLAVVVPFVTDHLMGGGDARWYGGMMLDFIHQERAGVFPIFLGQGESAFNGGIHPFRSAPLHLWLGGLFDVLTLRGLSVLALQHLTVVASSIGAALAMYLTLGSIVPARRWEALAVTAVFAFCPAQLAAIYAAEAYMTFMTFPWIVMVLYGNVLTFREEEEREKAGWWWIAVGSALTWLAHPSVGVYATIATLALQAGWLLTRGRTLRSCRRGVGCGAAFVALTLYYFVGMTETVPGQENSGSLAATVVFLAGGLALGAALWLWERQRRGPALLLFAAGGAGLALFHPVWGAYGLVVAALFAAVQWWRRCFPRLAAPGRRLEWIGGVLLAAVLATGWIVGRDFPGKVPTTDFSLSVARDALSHTWAPVPKDGVALGGFQAGWALIALWLASVLGTFRRATDLQRSFACAGIFFVLLYVPVPFFAEFFWGNLPGALVAVMSIAFDRRIFPVLVPLLAYAGYFALSGWSGHWRRAAVVALCALLPWSGWEAAKFVARGFAIRNPWLQTKNFYRPDTFLLTRYAYDLLKLPGTFSHGVMDYRLESRILENGSLTQRLGPEEYARAMEKGGTQELAVTARSDQPGSPWLLLSPRLEIPPNQEWVLRFHFTPGFPPGYFILPSENQLYREYAMPLSGFARSFGMAPGTHAVLTLQNFTDSVQRYNWEYQRSAGFAPAAGVGEFARVTVSRFDAARLPVHVTSLLPYRASLQLERAGWLETFRSWLPGYVATVDGRPAEVRESPDHLVMLPVPAGASTVEVRYAGSTRLWSALGASLLAWGLALAAGVVHLVRSWHRPAPPAA